MTLDCDIAFELSGRTSMAADAQPVEAGERLRVTFADTQEVLTVTVTKAVMENGRKVLFFNSPLIASVEKVEV